ncbi:MAG: PilN domain-containing protein [Myxococcales bacterium]|nr:PilN domain-containing protein [Myxococcales bacterium]
MIEINLLPVREARRKADIRELAMQVVLLLIITGGALGIVHSRLSDELDRSSARIRQMENDIEQFKPQLKQVAEFRAQKARLEKKIDVIEGLDSARSGPVRLLNDLATRTPDRLWLTSLDAKGKAITLKGESLDNEIVAIFLRELGKSEYFVNVDLDSTELGKEKKGVRLVTFNIRATVANPTKSGSDGDAEAG